MKVIEHRPERVDDAVATAVVAVGRQVTQDARPVGPEVDAMLAVLELDVNDLHRPPLLRQVPERERPVAGLAGRALRPGTSSSARPATPSA